MWQNNPHNQTSSFEFGGVVLWKWIQPTSKSNIAFGKIICICIFFLNYFETHP